jgi:putative flippase GtrA
MEMPGGAALRTARAARATAAGLRDRRGMTVGEFALRSDESALSIGSGVRNRLRMLPQRHRRPLCFLAVGGLGLVTDIILFTIAAMQGVHPLAAGFLALAAATLLTWRLNRTFTFDRSGRRQGEEAMRYAAVTAVAQGTSYAVFAVLAVTVLAVLPQAAIIAGAAVGALISYNGHRLFAFAPPKPGPETAGV